MDNFTNFSDVLDLVADATNEDQPMTGYAEGSLLYKSLPAHIYHADRDALSCSLLSSTLEQGRMGVVPGSMKTTFQVRMGITSSSLAKSNSKSQSRIG